MLDSFTNCLELGHRQEQKLDKQKKTSSLVSLLTSPRMPNLGWRVSRSSGKFKKCALYWSNKTNWLPLETATLPGRDMMTRLKAQRTTVTT